MKKFHLCSAALFVSAALSFASVAAGAQPAPSDTSFVDPEIAAMQAASTVKVPVAGTWSETANYLFYNSDLRLAWDKVLGDFFPTPLGSAIVPDLNRVQTVSIPVVGNDFYVLNVGPGGGSAKFASHRGPANTSPTLIVNGKTHYIASRDTFLTPTATTPQNTIATLDDHNVMLIAFDTYKPQPGDTAVLRLTTDKQYGAHKITVYHPNVHYVFPPIDAKVDGTIVRDIRPANFKPQPNLSVHNNILTGYWAGKSGTAISQLFALPPADEYFLTVVIRLDKDWVDQGGKLPGLSDTGQATNTGGVRRIINGINCDNSGWGGRGANGCRWSARTNWASRVGDQVGLATYFYAQQPHNNNGWVQPLPVPAPVGQWFAYVERVKVNTPGIGDGRVSYWMCTQQGCAPQFDRKDILFRSYDLPESKITEAWADVYCGGTSCGPAPWPKSTTDLSRMTVTVGLPDLNALYAEVQALNASGN